MAQGTVTVFEEAKKNMNLSTAAADLTNGVNLDADTFKIMLISDDIDTVLASTATPDSGDFTQVSGTNYTAGGETATITVTESGGTVTVALGSNVSWTSPGTGGPADIRSAILYSTTHTGTQDTFCVWDMTTDSGTTPLDLDNGDITINSGNICTIA